VKPRGESAHEAGLACPGVIARHTPRLGNMALEGRPPEKRRLPIERLCKVAEMVKWKRVPSRIFLESRPPRYHLPVRKRSEQGKMVLVAPYGEYKTEKDIVRDRI